jgi:putative ABC transport system permease protein
MRALDLKLLREVRRHWIQIASIALVMGCGTMTIMGLRSTLTSIRAARDDYYAEYRFADVFARVERAPNDVARRLASVPGVATVQTRIVRDVRLDVPGLPEPATGHVVGIPDVHRPMLNDLQLRAGRWIAPSANAEILVSERFAEVNHLYPGDSLSAVINGRWQRLHIVGVAISPEFVVEYAGGAAFIDSRRYAVVWASSRMLEAAFDMKDAFNDVSIRLSPDATERRVERDVDALLRRWGGGTSHGRADQPAARALEDEFAQLRTNAAVFPFFFLVVAAFLLNVVVSRLVASQRDEIAALKAFGYTNHEIGVHYLGFGVVAVICGALVGIPAGVWMGAKFTDLYHDYFRFPAIPSSVDWTAAAVGVAISGGCALLGAVSAVRRVVKLTPAEALRPEAPGRFRALLLEHLGLGRRLPTSIRMVLRNVERRPIRTASTVIGIGLAIALIAAGRFPYDAFDRVFAVEFGVAQRYDVLAAFTRQLEGAAARDLAHIDGVLAVEPFRSTAIRVGRGAAFRNTVINGYEPAGQLRRLADADGRSFTVPDVGCVMTHWLAAYLGVEIGDTIDVELLERGGVQRKLIVAGLFDPALGQGLYMSRRGVARLLGEDNTMSGAYLAVAPGREADVIARLKSMPSILAASSRAAMIDTIDEQMRRSMTFVLGLVTVSAIVIAVGVVYNSARIALSERGRELASLRVLGFTTNEVAGMLLGEQAAALVPALPTGVLFGAGFNAVLASQFVTERLHFPYVIAPWSQFVAAGVVVIAAGGASLFVRQRVGQLDMVTALRTRE